MTKRLTFKYADFLKGTKGTQVDGDGSTALSAGTYIVKTVLSDRICFRNCCVQYFHKLLCR